MSTKSDNSDQEDFLEKLRILARLEQGQNIKDCGSNPVCPWLTTINKKVSNCDCPKSLAMILGEDFSCDEKTIFCPVRARGWPEHIDHMVKNFNQALVKN